MWKNNADILVEENRLSFREIPAYREELYEMINERLYEKGIYDEGLAYEVADKTMRGYYARIGGVDEDTISALLGLDSIWNLFLFSRRLTICSLKRRGFLICVKRLQ